MQIIPYILIIFFVFLSGCSYPPKKNDLNSVVTNSKTVHKTIESITDATKNKNPRKITKKHLFEKLKNEDSLITSSNEEKNTIFNPSKNVFDRIRSGFSMEKLRTKRVDISVTRVLKDPSYVERVLERSRPYLHHIVEEIDKRQMPMELALLPFVESAYVTSATSRARAGGLWQFIPATGRKFGLKQNWWIDERRDVIKSTTAALDYLQYLHKLMDGDWFLALAAYNWGEASVRKAIKKNKARKRNTHYVYLKMPRETRFYVPKLMAIKKIVSNPEKYKINMPFIPDEPFFKQHKINDSIDSKLISQFSGINFSTLKNLNASNLRPVINKKYTSYIILPVSSIKQYKKSLEKHLSNRAPLVSWEPYTLKKGETLKKIAKQRNISLKELANANGIRVKNKFLKGTTLIVPHIKYQEKKFIASIENFKRPKLIRPAGFYWANNHKVKRGESLSTIARKYRTSVGKIKLLNNLRSDKIYAGQKLRISSRYAKNGLYRVRKGDSLYSIALMYRTSVSELKRINKLASDLIRVGTKLIVK